MWGRKAWLFREKLGEGWGVGGGEVCGEVVSQSLLPALMCFCFLFTQRIGVAQPAFRVFSEEICSICSCRFRASMGGSEFRILQVTISS